MDAALLLPGNLLGDLLSATVSGSFHQRLQRNLLKAWRQRFLLPFLEDGLWRWLRPKATKITGPTQESCWGTIPSERSDDRTEREASMPPKTSR
jgi:hypothetical protein